MNEFDIVMIQKIKDDSLWVGFLKDFKLEFSKEYSDSVQQFYDCDSDRIEQIASELLKERFNKNAVDIDLFSNKDYLNILQETAENLFNNDFKFNINAYSDNIIVLNCSEIKYNIFGNVFFKRK